MSNNTVSADDPTFSEFPKASREQWLALVSSVIKGAPFEKRLVSKSYDGIAIAPLYERASGGRAVPGRATGAPWRIVQRIELANPARANAQALRDLDNGATGLALVFAGAIGAYGFGLDGNASLAHVLDGIALDAGVAIDLQGGVNAVDVARQMTDLVRRNGVSAAATHISFGFDPLSHIAAEPQSATSWRDEGAGFAANINDLALQGHKGPFAAADGRVVHNAGGSEAQELAWALAAALAYLRALEASGVAPGDARRMIYFRLAADADQFLTTAKFRALRKLWARVEESCGLTPAPAFIAAETAWRMMTRHDPFVNMLRATVAVVAAGLGGADSIAVVPHTAAIGQPDHFARRIACNTQLILLEESNLAQVGDPAAGAGGPESLTHELCMAAWSLFQEIERAGGVAAALEQGLIQAKVAAVRAERERAIARGKDALTGTSEFPDIAEMPVEVLETAPGNKARIPPPGAGRSAAKRTGGGDSVAPLAASECHPAPLASAGAPSSDPPPSGEGEPDGVPAELGRSSPSITTLPCLRLAEPFEALRDTSDRVLDRTGARPKIFLANLGRLADFMARATYAKNLFEAGGIAALTNDGFASHEEMLSSFDASGASLACLCSSDAVYASEAAAAASALRGAGVTHIYLAGRPGELEPMLRAAGVGTFIHVGCDLLATLTAAYQILNLERSE
jgi:methylmalonyl-CoA mutase